MKRKTLFSLFAFVLLLTMSSCHAPERDPRNIADAEATLAESRRADEWQAAELAQKDTENSLRNSRAGTTLEIYQSISGTITTALHWSVGILAIVFIPTAALYLWRFGQSASETTHRLLIAGAVAAEKRANLIMIDPKTRTFPIQALTVGKDTYILNHNTGAKYRLDGTNTPPNPQLITALAQVLSSGVLADEARRGNGKAGTADQYGLINPPLVLEADNDY